jgi:hypothetical protein
MAGSYLGEDTGDITPLVLPARSFFRQQAEFYFLRNMNRVFPTPECFQRFARARFGKALRKGFSFSCRHREWTIFEHHSEVFLKYVFSWFYILSEYGYLRKNYLFLYPHLDFIL